MFRVTAVDVPHREELYIEVEFGDTLIAEVFVEKTGEATIEWITTTPFQASFLEFKMAMDRALALLRKFGLLADH